MDLVNYDKCRICRTDIDQLEEEGEIVYENYFCKCTGSARYICRTCIRLYIPRYPNHCHECRSEWRNVRLIHGPLSYQQFREIVEREQRKGERRWSNLGNIVWFLIVIFLLFFYEPRLHRGMSFIGHTTEHWNPLAFMFIIMSILICSVLVSIHGVNQVVDRTLPSLLYILCRTFSAYFSQVITDLEILD